MALLLLSLGAVELLLRFPMGNAATDELYQYGLDDGRCVGLDPDAEVALRGVDAADGSAASRPLADLERSKQSDSARVSLQRNGKPARGEGDLGVAAGRDARGPHLIARGEALGKKKISMGTAKIRSIRSIARSHPEAA